MLRELIRLYSHYSGKGIRFRGDYPSWQDASAEASGYDGTAIFEQVRAAALAVQAGKAAFDRDGVLFAEQDYPFPLLSGLLRCAARNHGRMHVLDFGGALGSTFMQCRGFFRDLPDLKWQVVEQSHYVEWARRNLDVRDLGFSSSLDEAFIAVEPNVVLFSGVLQYLEKPVEIVRNTLRPGVQYVIIDRTPFIAGSRSMITVQQVPKSLVESSYPAWLFHQPDLMAPVLDAGFRLLTEFPALDRPMGGIGCRVEFRGLIFERGAD